jgi:hypothetical protein
MYEKHSCITTCDVCQFFLSVTTNKSWKYPIVTMETDAEASGIENHGCLGVWPSLRRDMHTESND